MFTRLSHRWYVLTLSLVFAVVWMLLALHPQDRADWALENALVAVFLAVLAQTRRLFTLSRLSFTLIFIFLTLHEIGAHYTYAQVPYDEGFRFLFGFSLNESLGFTRNHFDRLVDFFYGFLLTYPIREALIGVAGVRGAWSYSIPVVIAMFTSMLFKLFEWGVVEFFGGDLGAAYLASQGDAWDVQKDMALVSLGALVSMLVTAAINQGLRRDFAAEWNESLRANIFQPLGENETRIKRLPRRRRRRS